MNKKSLMLVLGCYVIWGLLPLYWGLLSDFSPLFVLSNRIIWSALLTLMMIMATRQGKELIALFKNKQAMKYLIPAALVITLNWGLYIWAVSVDHILDASLGYFINPLAVFVCGVFFFKERFGKAETIAIIFAVIGVLITTIQVGEFPLVALTLALSFSFYAVMKKLAAVDGLLSVCVETLIVTPFALIFVIFAPITAGAFSSATPLELGLLVGSGIVTAIPLILYGQGVNNLSLVTMGLLQFIPPTLMFFISIATGEEVLSRLTGFIFIWVGLAFFVADLIRREKKELRQKA